MTLPSSLPFFVTARCWRRLLAVLGASAVLLALPATVAQTPTPPPVTPQPPAPTPPPATPPGGPDNPAIPPEPAPPPGQTPNPGPAPTPLPDPSSPGQPGGPSDVPPPDPGTGNPGPSIGEMPGQPPGTPQRVFLGYRWERIGNARYRITTHEKSSLESSAPGAQQQPEQTRESTLNVSIRPVQREGLLTWLELRLEHATLRALPQGIELDTASAQNPKAGPLAGIPAVFSAIADRPIRVLVTPGGRVQRLEGFNEFASAARNALPQSPQREEILALMLPMSEAALTGQLANVFFYLPGRSVEPGFVKDERLPSPTGAGDIDAASPSSARRTPRPGPPSSRARNCTARTCLRRRSPRPRPAASPGSRCR